MADRPDREARLRSGQFIVDNAVDFCYCVGCGAVYKKTRHLGVCKFCAGYRYEDDEAMVIAHAIEVSGRPAESDDIYPDHESKSH